MDREAAAPKHRSIFSPATARERAENFDEYWIYSQRNDGEILEDQKDLTKKQALRARFQSNAVRSRTPLPDPERFYRNCVTMQDDPQMLDRKTLLLTFLYKLQQHLARDPEQELGALILPGMISGPSPRLESTSTARGRRRSRVVAAAR